MQFPQCTDAFTLHNKASVEEKYSWTLVRRKTPKEMSRLLDSEFILQLEKQKKFNFDRKKNWNNKYCSWEKFFLFKF